MRTLIATLPFALAIAQTPVASLCDGPARPLGASRDLYCIEAYDKLGSIERGKLADLVVLDGNLASDPSVFAKSRPYSRMVSTTTRRS